jgi:hypothetical protein
MLFMIIEHFKGGDASPVGGRFKERGRMLPDGVTYQSSWVDLDGARCFQVMEAPDVETLGKWIACWDDLVDFDVVPVTTSADFWAGRDQ